MQTRTVVAALAVFTFACTDGSIPSSVDAASSLRVMTYNVLHGQPCSGGSLGSEVAPRMELAVLGGSAGESGLADLAPDVLGLQEVSQVLVDQSVGENQACGVLSVLPPPIGGVPEEVERIDAYEHAGDRIVRRLNGITTARSLEADRTLPSSSPYAMRFVRDNPRLLPLLPDVPLPLDDESLSDHATELGNVEIGLAVVSRLWIQQVTVHNLTIGEVPGETRALLHATIRVPDSGEAFDFYDSHLTTAGGDSPQTILMAIEIARFIATTRRHPNRPGFFTCDCNATEGSATYEVFRSAGFVDSFRVANPDRPGLTSGRDGLDTSCDQEVDKRIDYVWAIPAADGGLPEVISSRVVMDYREETAPGACRWPSDHNGVLTEFALPGGS